MDAQRLGGLHINKAYLEYRADSKSPAISAIYITSETLPDIISRFEYYRLRHTNHGDSVEVSPRDLSGLVELLWDYELSTDTKRIQDNLAALTVPPKMEILDNVVYPTFNFKPHKAQVESTMWILEKERYLLADMMGQGKGFASILMAEYLKANYGFKHVLVVNGVYNNQMSYQKEVEKASHENSMILGSRPITRGPRKGKRRIGGNAEKIEDLQGDIEEFYIITNIHALKDFDILQLILDKIHSGEIGFIVVDEVHRCAGHSIPKERPVVLTAAEKAAKKEQAAKDKKAGKKPPKKKKVAQELILPKLRSRYRVGMSGTPFNKPEDLYVIEAWLGYTYESKGDYHNRYGQYQASDMLANAAIARGVSAYRARMTSNVYVFTNYDAFAADVRRYLLRRTDSLDDLPPITFTDKILELPSKQRAAYDRISTGIPSLASLSSLASVTPEELNKGTYMPLRRILGSPRSEGVEEDIKLETTIELLEEIIANGKTAIVFTFFVDAAAYYKEALEKAFPGQGNYILSDTKDTFEAVNNFQTGNGSFLVGGVGRIGTGVNIQRADYVIYTDRPSTWNEYEQSFMRAWRQGRKSPVHVIKLICEDTWDDMLSLNHLESKFQSDMIMGQNHGDQGIVDTRYGTVDVDQFKEDQAKHLDIFQNLPYNK